MKKIAIVLASCLVVACASSPKTGSSLAANANDKKTSAVSATTAPAVSAEMKAMNAELLQLAKQSDYFDYNKYVIKPAYLKVIREQAEFIKGHKNDVVTLEGNADERGSEQYNLDLGSKRAKAVRQTLEKSGVPSSQIKIVSLGKDKPRLTCSEEKCWKENRRVDFVHSI